MVTFLVAEDDLNACISRERSLDGVGIGAIIGNVAVVLVPVTVILSF
jgi:hypothetical protein